MCVCVCVCLCVCVMCLIKDVRQGFGVEFFISLFLYMSEMAQKRMKTI